VATILAHIRVKEGTEPAFEALAADLYRATHGRETAVRRYEYWRGAEPRSYYSLLAFDDFHGFLAHQTSDHHEEASPRLGEMIEDIRLEWVDPLGEASDLPPTEPQEAPDGADELTQRYARLYAARKAAWWPRDTKV
jgi:quinol monooxygenase YgiN